MSHSPGKEQINIITKGEKQCSHLSVKSCVQRVLSAMKLALHAPRGWQPSEGWGHRLSASCEPQGTPLPSPALPDAHG